MEKFDWLQAFAAEQQEQPEPGVSADAAPEDVQERAEAFRALIQGPYKKDYDRQVQTIVRERLKKGAPELADTSRIVFSSATYETNVSSKTVDVTPEVNGRMVYGKYHISVSFDKDGNVTALTHEYAPLKEGGTKTVRLADAKTVQARLDAHEF